MRRMKTINYDKLDPGIRNTVKALNEAGFHTTDSGDGISKPADAREMDFPHVAMKCSKEQIHSEADRLLAFMQDREPGKWVVEATYFPPFPQTVLLLRGLSKEELEFAAKQVVEVSGSGFDPDEEKE